MAYPASPTTLLPLSSSSPRHLPFAPIEMESTLGDRKDEAVGGRCRTAAAESSPPSVEGAQHAALRLECCLPDVCKHAPACMRRVGASPSACPAVAHAVCSAQDLVVGPPIAPALAFTPSFSATPAAAAAAAADPAQSAAAAAPPSHATAPAAPALPAISLSSSRAAPTAAGAAAAACAPADLHEEAGGLAPRSCPSAHASCASCSGRGGVPDPLQRPQGPPLGLVSGWQASKRWVHIHAYARMPVLRVPGPLPSPSSIPRLASHARAILSLAHAAVPPCLTQCTGLRWLA